MMLESQENCAGRDCPRPANTKLRLRYLNLIGWFCENCAAALLRDNLALEAAENNGD
jgi:hypothetical protein